MRNVEVCFQDPHWAAVTEDAVLAIGTRGEATSAARSHARAECRADADYGVLIRTREGGVDHLECFAESARHRRNASTSRRRAVLRGKAPVAAVRVG